MHQQKQEDKNNKNSKFTTKVKVKDNTMWIYQRVAPNRWKVYKEDEPHNIQFEDDEGNILK
jgi:hypothetical protein